MRPEGHRQIAVNILAFIAAMGIVTALFVIESQFLTVSGRRGRLFVFALPVFCITPLVRWYLKKSSYRHIKDRFSLNPPDRLMLYSLYLAIGITLLTFAAIGFVIYFTRGF